MPWKQILTGDDKLHCDSSHGEAAVVDDRLSVSDTVQGPDDDQTFVMDVFSKTTKGVVTGTI